ncbi:MAG: N-6 DNA methylase [Planctomycetota bacterium]
MREEQGWIIKDDPEGIRDNLERAAKFASYALVNKLVFHEALLKRYGAKLGKLQVPKHIDTSEGLRLHLEGYFEDAKKVTGDYETVFGEDHAGIGNRIPFYSDAAVDSWRSLINDIHEYDFSKIDYEVIGSIFERLISPEERHKYGQFYTRPEVVDLMNAFCIRTGRELVMDPACGGGTFLVRAYARKRELAPERKHGELLSDLYGVDISHFAGHLTTINLATRDLIDDENYPQIARSDFFDVESGRVFMSVPSHVKARGLGEVQQRDISIPPLDAVVGNPPYVRQEHIQKARKEFYQRRVKEEAGADLAGRSDIHCYFWPHAATFLKDDGYLSLITSSQWLDVEYGFKLQKWILRKFEIVAVMESLAEPWFIGARVATTVTVLRKQADETKRMRNLVRFVQFRKPLSEILAHDGTTGGAMAAANAFRDELLGLRQNAANERYRARLVPQGDLWNDGVRLGVMMGKSKDGGTDDDEVQDGEYYGGKWGVYLRAPDLWFKLLDKYGDRFAHLGDIAEVRFGVKTGKDCFFFPIDASGDCLKARKDDNKFEAEYGVPRKDIASGKVKLVKAGEKRGELFPIEAEYLEPEVHSLMEIDGFTVAPEDCARLILLVGKQKKELKGTYVLDYIEWGEKQGYHKGATCAARVSKERGWYDLTGHKRGAMFWPMAQQYKHTIPANDHDLICNHNLFDVTPEKSNADTLAGCLNSSFVVLSKFQYGRPVGVEGNLKTEVVDAKMMLVPNPVAGIDAAKPKIIQAMKHLKNRKALYFISERRLREMAYKQRGKENELVNLSDESELDMADRRELDDAVLELLGIASKKERQSLIDELYTYLREFFEWTRRKEEQAIVNKKATSRRGQVDPNELAVKLYEHLHDNEPHLLKSYDPDFLDGKKPFDTYELPTEGVAVAEKTLFSSRGVSFKKGRKQPAYVETKMPGQDALVELVANSGVRGIVRFPRDAEEIERLQKRYGDFIRQRENRVKELIEERTADKDIQERIRDALMPMLIR